MQHLPSYIWCHFGKLSVNFDATFTFLYLVSLLESLRKFWCNIYLPIFSVTLGSSVNFDAIFTLIYLVSLWEALRKFWCNAYLPIFSVSLGSSVNFDAIFTFLYLLSLWEALYKFWCKIYLPICIWCHFWKLSVKSDAIYTHPQDSELKVLAGLRPAKNENFRRLDFDL